MNGLIRTLLILVIMVLAIQLDLCQLRKCLLMLIFHLTMLTPLLIIYYTTVLLPSLLMPGSYNDLAKDYFIAHLLALGVNMNLEYLMAVTKRIQILIMLFN